MDARIFPLPKPSYGFSMFELLMVVGIIAVLGAVIFSIYPQVRDNNYVNIERERLLRSIAVVQALHFQVGNYVGLTTDSANQAGAFVDEANGKSKEPGTVIRNIWGGTIQFGPAANTKFMRITYTQVSMEGCMKLFSGVGKSVVSVVVNDTQIYRESDGYDIDVTAAVEACAENPAGATMVFTAN